MHRLTLVVLVVAATESMAAAESEPCRPAAAVDGDTTIAGAVSEELLLLGVARDAGPGCRVASARVAPSASGLHISMRDAAGRVVQREVTDARIAATWIDSRLRDDIGTPLLAPRSVPRYSAPAAGAGVDVGVVAASAGSWTDRVSATVGFERSYANDGGEYDGVRASVCAELGGACVGLSGRLASGSRIPELFPGTRQERRVVDVMAQVTAPIAVGKATALPRAGVGLAYLRTAHGVDASDCLTDPEPPIGDPDIEPCGLPPETFTSNPRSSVTYAGRAEVGVDLSLPIANSVFVELGVSADATLGGRNDDGIPMGGTGGSCGVDEGCDDEPPLDAALAPDPTRFWRLGIGLRVGAP